MPWAGSVFFHTKYVGSAHNLNPTNVKGLGIICIPAKPLHNHDIVSVHFIIFIAQIFATN